ncbi:MAG: C10 family peptidase [Desulfobacterales bacterium]
MKRIISLFSFLLLLSGGMVWAAPVTQGTARRAAVCWMSEVTGEKYTAASISEMFAESGREDSAYFVFNFEPEGWVIISADDTAHPVIGYSETGRYAQQFQSPSFKQWMKTGGRQIREARKKRISPSEETAKTWERLLADEDSPERRTARADSVPPLLQTTWNQDQYYNEHCPVAANAPSYAGGHAFAGCVATAMAQIMKYHAYPAQGIGTHTYSDPINRNYYGDIPGSAYGTQSADFGNTVYNWAAMPNAISSSHYEIARLIYHCGVSVEMNFGPEGSSGSTYTAADSLKKYFKYDDALSLFSKSDYTDAVWISMLKADLDAGRPILYSGSGTGGHAFVCDGYQANNYFHFNWGWGGYLDGYFYLTALTPGGDNYTNDQDAVLKIQPSVVPTLIFPYSQGFEAGTVPSEWRVSGEKAVISSTGKHTGTWSLMLGAADSGFYWTNLAVLKINVPENGHLSFWVKRGYSPGPCQWNRQKAYIKSEFGDTVLHTFFDGEYNDSAWQNITLPLTAWKNKVIKLCFELEKSCDWQEWMYIDDIQITGTAAQLPQVFWDVSASSQTVDENAGTATYAVRLNTAASQNITVPFTVSGTAAAGTDHNLTDGSITVPAGSTSASKTFQITDDSSKESDETVILTLRTPTNAVLGTPVNLTITIRDNDSIAVDPDMYEINNTEAQAFALSPVFSANTATVKTVRTTIHSSTDLDYFKITLASGYNYSLSSRVHDSGSSADGSTYTCNVKYSYKTGAWSAAYDIQAPAFSVNDGGTVVFKVEPFTAGATGTYALEITIVREEIAGSPILSVSPSYHTVSAAAGWVSFTVTNTGEGAMTWTASAAQDWLSAEYDETTLSVSYLYNSGTQRTGIVTITAPGAENSPKTVQIIQAAGAVLSPDSYEVNDQESQAANLSVNFTDSTATVKTSGANLHQTEDRDYYSISLPEGYDYTVSARVHDSYASGDGQTYTGDVKFSFRLGNQWYGDYDTAPGSSVSVQGGQTLLYKVIPWDSNQMGTYALELSIRRTASAVPLLSVQPSVQNVPAVKGSAQFTVFNAGQGSMTWSALSDNDWITVDYDAQYLYVFCADNYGAERTGIITVNSAEAENSPQTVQVVQAAGSVLGADSYESNNTQVSAALLTLNFSAYSASVKTSGANFHDSTDTDYFRISLASGYDYILLARLHDSYKSADGQNYSADAKFNYDAGTGWSASVYDTEAPEIRISGGGTVYFMVEPYFQGETGTYALEISAVRVPSGTTQPFLYVTPLSSNVSYSSVWTKYSVVNAGGGTLEWEAAGSSDWIYVVSRPSENAVYVNYSYNFGAARSGTVTVTATGATNSPQTIEIHQAAGMMVAADSYESNNIQSSAALLQAVFSGDTAVVRARNATLHTYDDRDWYAVTLPAGYDYTVSPRLHDRYSSNDGNTYTCDLAFYYYTPDGIMHYDYDDGYYYYGYDTDAEAFQISDGGTVYFEAEPWSYGEAGTYTFEVAIVRTARTVAHEKGDLDGIGGVNLSDAILALQISAGIPVSDVNLQGDVNADGRIGLADAVYVLRKAAGLP